MKFARFWPIAALAVILVGVGILRSEAQVTPGGCGFSSASACYVQGTIGPGGISDVNVAKVNGATVNVGTGAASTGTARVAVSSDSSIILAAGTAAAGNFNLAPLSTGGCTSYQFISTASTNSQLVGSAGAHTMCGGVVVNTTGTLGYLRFYDSATAPTCSSATGAIYSIPIPASASGAGVALDFGSYGFKVTAGLSYCITGGGATNDNTNAPAGIYVNLAYAGA